MAEELNTDTPEQQETPAVQSVMSAQPKTLSVADVKSKIDTQTPLYSNEYLPNVPKGTSAKGFYGQFRGYGGASVYSQPPFASSLSTVQGTSFLPQQPQPQPVEEIAEEEPQVPVVTTPSPVETQTGDSATDSFSDQLDSLLSQSAITTSPEEDFFTQIKNQFVDIPEFDLEELGVDKESFSNTLDNIGKNIIEGVNTNIDEGKKAIKDAYDEILPYIQNPNTIISGLAQNFVDSISDLGTNLSNLTDPEQYEKSLDYFGGVFKDTLVANLISSVALKVGVPSVLTGPIGILASVSFSEGDDARIGEVGSINVGYKDSRSLLGMTFNEVSKLAEENDDRLLQVSHFNSDGIAVDKNNRVVATLRGPGVVQESSVMVNSAKGFRLAHSLSPEELQTRADITAARDKDDIFSTPFMDSYDEVGGGTGDADDDEEDEEVDVVDVDDVDVTGGPLVGGTLPDEDRSVFTQSQDDEEARNKEADKMLTALSDSPREDYTIESKDPSQYSVLGKMLGTGPITNVTRQGMLTEDDKKQEEKDIAKVVDTPTQVKAEYDNYLTTLKGQKTGRYSTNDLQKLGKRQEYISVQEATEKRVADTVDKIMEKSPEERDKNIAELKQTLQYRDVPKNKNLIIIAKEVLRRVEDKLNQLNKFGVKRKKVVYVPEDTLTPEEEAASFTDFMSSVGTDPNRSEESKTTTFDYNREDATYTPPDSSQQEQAGDDAGGQDTSAGAGMGGYGDGYW